MYKCPKDGKMIVCPHFDCMCCDKSTKIDMEEGLIVLRPEECIKAENEQLTDEVD